MDSGLDFPNLPFFKDGEISEGDSSEPIAFNLTESSAIMKYIAKKW